MKLASKETVALINAFARGEALTNKERDHLWSEFLIIKSITDEGVRHILSDAGVKLVEPVKKKTFYHEDRCEALKLFVEGSPLTPDILQNLIFHGFVGKTIDDGLALTSHGERLLQEVRNTEKLAITFTPNELTKKDLALKPIQGEGTRHLDYHAPHDKLGKAQVDLNDPLKVQVGGDHYRKMRIQPVEFIMANDIGFLEGCVIKRVCRYKDKDGLQDLIKAKHEIDLLIKKEYPDATGS